MLDRAISYAIMLELMVTLEDDWEEDLGMKHLDIALESCFYVITFTLALRGEEVSLIELRGVHNHWSQLFQHKKPHVVITLLGRFKNEIRESYHLMPVLASTLRVLHPRKWVGRFLEEYQKRGIQ
jgi:hypothetical protein